MTSQQNAGTILGGVSLAIQLAGSCLKGYKVITSVLKASEDSRWLSLQFEIEQSRLWDFCRAAGLAEGASEDGANRMFFTKTTVLLNLLSEIEFTLAQYANDEEHQEGSPSEGSNRISPSDPASPSSLSEGYGALSSRLSRNLRSTPKTWGAVSNATWSLFRKEESETFLQRLGRYNDFLHELLDAQQLRDLRDEQRQRFMELLQMRTSLDDMRDLTRAIHAASIAHQQSNTWQHIMDEEFANLARFKTEYASLLVASPSQERKIRLDSSRIRLVSAATAQLSQTRAIYASSNEEKKVWIDWPSLEITDEDSAPSPISAIEELTILLMAPKPDQFCIPTCLGYTVLKRGEEKSRPALLFENPPNVDQQAQPISLLYALEHCAKPSLSHRIILANKIAQSLLYLHAVNWLHKALRSSNILLFPSADADVNIRSPFLTGFDNSRRSRFKEISTEVPRDGRMEVYRHPDTQLDGDELPYRKTSDVYSLGLVLVEIAFWEQITSVMDIEEIVDAPRTSRQATKSVQERWLSSEPALFEFLRAEMGDKYAGAVETCLRGRNAFGVQRDDLETSPDTGIRIQREFYSKVLRPLSEIIV